MTIRRAIAPGVCIAVLTTEMAIHEATVPDQPHTHSENTSGDSLAWSPSAFAAGGTATVTMLQPEFKR